MEVTIGMNTGDSVKGRRGVQRESPIIAGNVSVRSMPIAVPCSLWQSMRVFWFPPPLKISVYGTFRAAS